MSLQKFRANARSAKQAFGDLTAFCGSDSIRLSCTMVVVLGLGAILGTALLPMLLGKTDSAFGLWLLYAFVALLFLGRCMKVYVNAARGAETNSNDGS